MWKVLLEFYFSISARLYMLLSKISKVTVIHNWVITGKHFYFNLVVTNDKFLWVAI